ncbi:heme-binding protein 1 isoform X3 [Rhinatrema bivittatum]|uniref:heme-binding protein 1 isoform X3 n=1 Tax=Rhinatrema bivittatum TaxID=194408 RepID=UPI00112A4133|nr:heme-binding protein 1 isoform X3 [Rhinatrema bivittatum]
MSFSFLPSAFLQDRREGLKGPREIKVGTLLRMEKKKEHKQTLWDDVLYEERVYDAGKYAAVEVTGKPFDEASREAVLQLLKYVGGTNQKGTGMGMTAPVTITAFPSEDGSLQQRVKVLLRIPSQYQEDPPAPSESSIQIEERESVTVYSTLAVLPKKLTMWLMQPSCARPWGRKKRSAPTSTSAMDMTPP